MSDVAEDRAGIIPVLDVDPFSSEVLRNPYPFHEMLREAGPIAWLKPYGVYAVGRYSEVRAVLTDWKAFTTTAGAGMSDIRKPDCWRPASAILEIDPPDHTAVRSALASIVSPAVVRQWRQIFEGVAETMADRLVAQGEVDAVRDVAEAFVLSAFPQAIGIDVPREAAIAIGDMNFNALGPQNQLYKRSVAAAEPYLAWYEEGLERDKARPGGFAAAVYEAEDAGAFAPGVGKNLVRSFLRGGMDTTISGIGFSLRLLAENPDQWQLLRDDPSRVKNILDEAIRLESPSQPMFRTTRDATVFRGYQLEGGVKVAAFIGAGNRDPRQWDNPDRFDIMRKTGGHLAFGLANHACIGQTIARMEAECILSALLKRVKRLELAGNSELRPVNVLRTLRNLPLRLIV